MEDSYVVSKERCPHCAKLGKDNSHDNLAVYSDGHKFCFSCKFTVFPNKIDSFKRRHSDNDESQIENLIYLPVDCDIIYPDRALRWIEQYELHKNDLLNHNVMWSESMQRLIFPIYGDGVLLGWQGRYFGTDDRLTQNTNSNKKTAKWFGIGKLQEIFNILGDNKSNKIVLCEDVISSIKVSKCGVMAMPLYGSFIGADRFKRLFNLFGKTIELVVWLDLDKAKEATKEAKLGTLYGLNCSTIITKLDPKELKYDEIRKILSN